MRKQSYEVVLRADDGKDTVFSVSEVNESGAKRKVLAAVKGGYGVEVVSVVQKVYDGSGIRIV